MTEYLLILTIMISDGSGLGAGVSTQKIPDKESCHKAGKAFLGVKSNVNIDYRGTSYNCIQITKDSK